jgi:hypothetical protein
VNRSAMLFEAKIYRLQPVLAAMRTARFGVDDVGGHLAFLATFAVQFVHLL